tara:strand:+ start:11832 stop:12005 length:174 start_codon:yes stop_codon:yes gene_type:complete
LDKNFGLPAAAAVSHDTVWKFGFVKSMTGMVEKRFDHLVFAFILIRLEWQPNRSWLS